MFVSDRFVLLANPRTGVGCLSRYLGANAVAGMPPHSTPQEIRKAHPELWTSRTTVLTLREPVARFVSAVRNAWRQTGGSESEMPADEVLARETLDLIASGFPDDRRDLWPQSRWLGSKIDILLPLVSFQPFVGSQPHTGRKFIVGNTYAYRSPALSDATRAVIAEAYAEDVARLAKLPVWPSKGGRVYLMTGRCEACEKAKRKSP